MTEQNDLLISQYLDAVRRAAADLPRDQREELLTDLREHITTARAELQPETETGVRTMLARLGDPAGIVAEARLGRPPVVQPPSKAARNVVLVVLGVILVPIVLCLLAGALLAACYVVTPTTQVPSPVVSSAR